MFVDTGKSDVLPMRRSQRVLARIPLCVMAKINEQVPFKEESFTTAITADGGVLQLRKPVRIGQSLALLQANTGQLEYCTVAHVEPIENGVASVRVQFLEPHPEFWHVSFPPEDWTPHHPDSKFKRQSLSQDEEKG
jgi:hypothetical protein